MDDEEEQDHLITNTKALAGKLIRSVDYHKNLATVKGNEELIRKLKDLFSDFDEHEEKLRLTISTSSYVQRNLVSLQTTMTEVDDFLTELSSARTLFFSKTRIKNKLYHILHALRAKNTQLMTSITLELLSRVKKPGSLPEIIPVKPARTVEFDLGYAFFHGICRPKNYVLAMENFKEAAKQGDAEAMFMLAECYSEELGIEKDEHLASEWIEKAASLNCPGAIHKQAIGILKAFQFKNSENVHKLLSFCESGTEINFNDTLTLGSEQDHVLSPLSPARARGESSSPLRFSKDVRRYDRNRSITAIDNNPDEEHVREEEDGLNLEVAVQLLLRAAELGDVAAKTDLGILFELANDNEKAMKWFTLSSNAGCPKATNRLGLLYFHGKGATQNLERAFSLFVSAARAGDRDANNNAGACLEQGLGTELRPAAAVSFYTKGAEQESPQAMYSLGYLLIRSSVKIIEDLTVAREMQSVHGVMDRDRRGAFSSLKDKYSRGKVPQGLLGSHRGPDGAGTRVVGRGSEVGFGVTSLPKPRKSMDSTSIGEFPAGGGGGKGPNKPPRPLSSGSTADSPMYNTPFEDNMADNTLSLIIPTRTCDARDPNADSLEAQYLKAENQVKEGVRWLRAAAERGVLDARYQLGLVYQQGLGCPSDVPSALSQYEYAAKEGHPRAAVAAGNILYDNLRKEHSSSSSSDISKTKPFDPQESITDARYRRVLDLYRVAAVGGLPEAMNCLGLLLEDGRGCAGRLPDPQESASWYMEGCVCGVHDSAVNLALLLSKGAVSSIRSLDGIQLFSLLDAINWLKKYSAEVDMPILLKEELDVLLAQLASEANAGHSRGALERVSKGLGRGQEREEMEQFEDSQARGKGVVGYAGGVIADPSGRRGSGGRELRYEREEKEDREVKGEWRDRRDEKDDYDERDKVSAGSREIDLGKQDRERLRERERAREWEAEKEREREWSFGQRTMH